MAIRKFGVYAKASRFINDESQTGNKNTFNQNEFWETFAQNAFSANAQMPDSSQNTADKNEFPLQNSAAADVQNKEEPTEQEKPTPSPASKKKNGVFAAYVAAHNARAAKIR